jgi:DNA invertase Pin-like site-specific DNA recombinase
MGRQPIGADFAALPADARRQRAVRDRRVLDALRLGGSATVIAAAIGISPQLVRRIAHEARKTDQPAAVPPRKPYRRAKKCGQSVP